MSAPEPQAVPTEAPPSSSSAAGQRLPTEVVPGPGRRRGGCLLWVLGLLAVMVGLAFIPGGEKASFHVDEEFVLEPLLELPPLGPIDLSINKAVIYLWISVAIIVVLAIVISRTIKAMPGRFQVVVESLYDLARDGITGSVMHVGAARWFPFIGALFFFILINNLVGLIPLPFGHHHELSFYVATANINVTIGLAACTFVFTHYAGIRARGGLAYVKSWAPADAPPVLKQLIWGIHGISEVFRLVSLSVRLFANMLAGHAILGVFFAMALVFQNYLAAAMLQAGSVAIYLFEIFIAFIQAFIFAILSAVYIGGALEEGH